MNFRSLVELDARVSNRMRVAEQPGILRNISIVFAHSGDSWFWGLALILLWAFTNNEQSKIWAVMIFGSISILALIVVSLKFIIRRRRPEGEWGAIYRNTDPHSFPSGHAARAFLIALMTTGFGFTSAGILLWVWAPLVGIARVAMGVHYVSDIIAGLFVGFLVALIGLEVYAPILDWVVSRIGFPLW
ncbi:MAG: phosphatase PAP2 family protein [Anaerolineae bacterium]|nr:phosphatase PAP2 family protein [Anaerolineae bacterium]